MTKATKGKLLTSCRLGVHRTLVHLLSFQICIAWSKGPCPKRNWFRQKVIQAARTVWGNITKQVQILEFCRGKEWEREWTWILLFHLRVWQASTQVFLRPVHSTRLHLSTALSAIQCSLWEQNSCFPMNLIIQSQYFFLALIYHHPQNKHMKNP